jgi:group I intron endonuclease
MENDYLVYKHTSPSGRAYIGITSNYSRRCRQHQSKARTGSTLAFHRAIRKYGWSNFTHEVLAFDLTKQQACDMEVALIDVADKSTLYNMTAGGEGVDSESSRRGLIAKRKDSVKNYTWSESNQSYQVKFGYLGKKLAFGRYKNETDAKDKADYLMSLSDEELVKAHEEYQAGFSTRSKGYSFNKVKGKYQVRLTVDGKQRFFGYYISEQEAIERIAQLRNEF